MCLPTCGCDFLEFVQRKNHVFATSGLRHPISIQGRGERVGTRVLGHVTGLPYITAPHSTRCGEYIVRDGCAYSAPAGRRHVSATAALSDQDYGTAIARAVTPLRGLLGAAARGARFARRNAAECRRDLAGVFETARIYRRGASLSMSFATLCFFLFSGNSHRARVVCSFE
jgi:hypothetical protein